MQRRFLPLVLALPGIVLPAQSDTNRKEVQTVVDALVAAWNAHDAPAFSARFMDDGSFANILGMTSFGREPFERQHQRIFAGIYRNSHATFTIDRIKMLRPDVALVDMSTVLVGYAELPPGITPGADGALHTKLEMVMLKQPDGWWIASFHNVAVGAVPPPR